MKKFHTIFLFFSLFFLVGFAFANDKEIYTKVSQSGDEVLVKLFNKSLHHITLEYKADFEGLHPLQKVPFTQSYKPFEEKVIARFQIVSVDFSFRGNFHWVVGTRNATHDDSYLYRLPYELGEKRVVTQGFHGKFSHTKNSKYAIDFAMESGSKIFASRGGRVVKIKQDSKVGGVANRFKKEANYILIRHSDNTYAKYAHLQFRGALVQKGDWVKRGDLLGYSGNTGYSSGPHLHLVVFRSKNIHQRESLPIKFIAKQGIISKPLKGKFYTAAE